MPQEAAQALAPLPVEIQEQMYYSAQALAEALQTGAVQADILMMSSGDIDTQAVIRKGYVFKTVKAKPRKLKTRSFVLAFALVALIGTALAANLPATVTWIESMFGNRKVEDLKKGTLMPIHQTFTLGEVDYEWLETIHVGDTGKQMFGDDSNMLYGTVRITPHAGANIVLIPEDTALDDFIGYNRYLGEIAPEGTPTFLEHALEKDARIILAKAVPKGNIVNGVLQEDWEIMYGYRSYPDGSLTYHYGIMMVEEAEEYTIMMNINNWEVTREGKWLREEPNNTWLRDDWVVTMKPGE